MSSKKKYQVQEGESVKAHEELLDTLSKEEKEALLNRKMLEIRRKNEELQRRHALIEADKARAEQEGSAVSLKQHTDEHSPSPEQPPPVKLRGVREAESGGEKKSAFSVGRGRRLANMKQESHKSSTQHGTRKPRPKSQVFQDKSLTEEQMKKRPKSQSFDMPPEAGSSSGFLQDHSRQGPLPEKIRQRSSRNKATYGGEDFTNVRKQMQYEKQRGPRRSGEYSGALELTMTGRERREYVAWKEERDRIDTERLQRASRNDAGSWKREWDSQKTLEAPVPPPSRRVEPMRRPAGRIGSGRFIKGEEQNPGEVILKSGPRQEERQGGYNERREQAGRDSDHSCAGLEDRHVQAGDDQLIIQVVNDYSGEVLDSRRRPERGRGRGERGRRGRGNALTSYSQMREGPRPNEREGYSGYAQRGHRQGQRGEAHHRGGRHDGNYRGHEGSYHGHTGLYRGHDANYRGRGRGVGGGGAPPYKTEAQPARPNPKRKGWAEWEAEQAEREARRAGRRQPEPLDSEILGRAIIVTTSSTGAADTAPDPASPGEDKEPTDRLSGDESWETTDEEDTEATQDQYEEDDYWEDSLQLHGQATREEALDEPAPPHDTSLDTSQQSEEQVPSETRDDVHNSSAESLDRFIQEHTLHLNFNTGGLEIGKSPVPDKSLPSETSALNKSLTDSNEKMVIDSEEDTLHVASNREAMPSDDNSSVNASIEETNVKYDSACGEDSFDDSNLNNKSANDNSLATDNKGMEAKCAESEDSKLICPADNSQISSGEHIDSKTGNANDPQNSSEKQNDDKAENGNDLQELPDSNIVSKAGNGDDAQSPPEKNIESKAGNDVDSPNPPENNIESKAGNGVDSPNPPENNIESKAGNGIDSLNPPENDIESKVENSVDHSECKIEGEAGNGGDLQHCTESDFENKAEHGEDDSQVKPKELCRGDADVESVDQSAHTAKHTEALENSELGESQLTSHNEAQHVIDSDIVNP